MSSSFLSLTHCWKRRWQVWDGGYFLGSSRHCAPVPKTHKIPLSTARVSCQGRPRPSARCRGRRIGSINFHWASLSSHRPRMPSFSPVFLPVEIANLVQLFMRPVLVLATMLADFAWCFFMIVGIEQVQFKHGMGAGNYLNATNIAMSHSLLMDVIWATLFAAAYFLRRHYPRGALVVFLAILSHWPLDFVSHRPDMPVTPGTHAYFGLGLWTSIPATLIVEGGFWVLAIIFYVRITRPRNRASTYVFWSGIVLLTLVWCSNIAGPPPPNPTMAPIASLVFFSLSVVWAYSVNRLRNAQPA